MNLQNLTAAQLKQAADIVEQVEELQAGLARILGSSDSSKPPGKRGPKKGGMSAEGRARIAEAQRARWAKINGSKGSKAPKEDKPVKKHRMSAKGRAAIAAAQKARWEKVKAAKAGQQTPQP